MTDKPGPWDLPDAPPSPPAATPAAPRDRLWLWLGALAAVGVLIAALAHAYPEALRSGDDKVELVYRLMLVLLVSGGLLRAARRPLTRHLKHAVIWMAAFAVLAFGYAYRTELADAPRRLLMAFNIGAPIQVDERTLVVPQSDDGAYVVDGLVNGQRVRFTVDTGSTDTVLSPDDARRLGVAVDKLDYAYKAETANGTGYGAVFAAKSLEIGSIRLRDVPLMVNKTPMSQSLLGMSFLKRLDAFEFRGRTLVLKWREDDQGRAL